MPRREDAPPLEQEGERQQAHVHDSFGTCSSCTTPPAPLLNARASRREKKPARACYCPRAQPNNNNDITAHARFAARRSILAARLHSPRDGSRRSGKATCTRRSILAARPHGPRDGSRRRDKDNNNSALAQPARGLVPPRYRAGRAHDEKKKGDAGVDADADAADNKVNYVTRVLEQRARDKEKNDSAHALAQPARGLVPPRYAERARGSKQKKKGGATADADAAGADADADAANKEKYITRALEQRARDMVNDSARALLQPACGLAPPRHHAGRARSRKKKGDVDDDAAAEKEKKKKKNDDVDDIAAAAAKWDPSGIQ